MDAPVLWAALTRFETQSTQETEAEGPSHGGGPCFAKLVFGIVSKRPTNTCTPTGSSIRLNMNMK